VVEGPFPASGPAPNDFASSFGPDSVGRYTRYAEISHADGTVICVTPTIAVSVQEPSTIFTDQTPGSTLDAGVGIELGLKFRADVSGTVTGIRFYKVLGDMALHLGSLWTAQGELLATGIFEESVAVGWEELQFPTPVPIAPNTTYVVSYYTSQGFFNYDFNTFALAGIDRPPLHALKDGTDGSNSVFAIGGPGQFPTQGYAASNYWVDVFFSASSSVDGKRTRFEYPGMTAFIEGRGSDWRAQDAALSVANASTGQNWVRVTFVADDPNFHYGGTMCQGAVGVCSQNYFAPRPVNGYSATERWTGADWNVIGLAFDSDAPFRWTGTIVIESENGTPFYSFDPHLFNPVGFGPSIGTALHAAWAAWAADVPSYWDEDLQMFVVPYTNFYHNHTEWQQGWQTNVTITNTSLIPVAVTIENHTFMGGFGSAAQPCPWPFWDSRASNMDAPTTLLSLGGLESQTIDLYRSQFVDADAAYFSLESNLYVRTSSGRPADLRVDTHVGPNDSMGQDYHCSFLTER
jgi:hypothetical protein